MRTPLLLSFVCTQALLVGTWLSRQDRDYGSYNWAVRHEALLKLGAGVELVFLGDSILHSASSLPSPKMCVSDIILQCGAVSLTTDTSPGKACGTASILGASR